MEKKTAKIYFLNLLFCTKMLNQIKAISNTARNTLLLIFLLDLIIVRNNYNFILVASILKYETFCVYPNLVTYQHSTYYKNFYN